MVTGKIEVRFRAEVSQGGRNFGLSEVDAEAKEDLRERIR